ncbi:MAG: DUF58 domain-containing protein [Planctomycetota bacterium]
MDAAPAEQRSTSSAASSADAKQPDASLYLHPQTLARLGSFELRAKMIVEGVMSGMHRSPYRGVSVEFAQHRAYSPGDDLRHLDWKVYAKTDKLQVKQYQQETNLDLVVLVDSSGSMNYGTRSFESASGEGAKQSLDGRTNWTKFDHATALAAALSYVTLRQGDRSGLVVFADEIRAMVGRSSSRGTWRQIVGALSTETVDAPTDFPRAIDQVLGSITNRAMLVVISDFFTDLDAVRTALARVKHRGHDVIAFQILDRSETDFAFADAAPFEGLEGEGTLRVDPRALRAGYLDAISEHNRKLDKLFRSFGFDVQQFGTHDWLGPPLAAYVARRNALLKRSKHG